MDMDYDHEEFSLEEFNDWSAGRVRLEKQGRSFIVCHRWSAMDNFLRHEGRLHAEKVDLALVAREVGTPCYVYSRASLERQWRAFDSGCLAHRPHLVCYSVKANSNLAVLQTLARLGSGFDIVSGGELQRVLQAGGCPSNVVFSGVGKRADEIRQALEVDIKCFNVESRAELYRINAVASKLGKMAPVAVRVNPDVDARTHPYMSTGLSQNKFGIDIDEAVDVYAEAARLSNVNVKGIDFHIGSQLTEMTPVLDALDRVLRLVDRLAEQGICELTHLNVGGGLGIAYKATDTPPLPNVYVAAVLELIGKRPLEVLLEPGRSIAGNAGILLTRVEYLKRTAVKNFAIVDAGMTDLLRPALYSAWHDIVPIKSRSDLLEACYDVVGPVCETGDFLGKDRCLAIEEGDLLAVCSAGAYGFAMSSAYNSRPRAAEVMVHGASYHIIRERETILDLMKGEHLLPEQTW